MSQKTEVLYLFVFVEVADRYGYALHVDYAVAVHVCVRVTVWLV